MKTLTEIWGQPATGKTHTAVAGWPNPLLVDTAFTSLGFRDVTVDPDPDERGESWPVVMKVFDYDESEADAHYHYLSEWPDSLDFADGYDTIILDNAADLRVLAANAWCEQNDAEWPQQSQWGAVNDSVDRIIRHLNRKAHVVVISQTKDEYVNDMATGNKVRDGPKRMDFKADWRIKLEMRGGADDAPPKRHSLVKKNRFLDATSDAYIRDFGSSVSFEELAMASGITEMVQS